jgi:hypothetical protein
MEEQLKNAADKDEEDFANLEDPQTGRQGIKDRARQRRHPRQGKSQPAARSSLIFAVNSLMRHEEASVAGSADERPVAVGEKERALLQSGSPNKFASIQSNDRDGNIIGVRDREFRATRIQLRLLISGTEKQKRESSRRLA